MFSKRFSFWSIVALLLSIVFISPIIIILSELFFPVNENWQHVLQHVLLNYLKNTGILIAGVTLLAGIIGISTAWLVSQFNFIGKTYIEWLLVMPLAIPTYIMAYAYAGIFDFFITEKIIPAYFDIKNMAGLIVMLSFSLFPYVYMLCKNSFTSQNASLIDAAKTMGKGNWETFFKVALPLARTAIIAGISILVMELLNDYGAVKYFGIETITTGIFRTWFSMGDLNTAIRLCAIVLTIVIFFLTIERIQRGKKTLTEMGNQYKKGVLKNLVGFNAVGVIFICSLPILFGFIIPLIKIIHWVVLTAPKTFTFNFGQSLFNTFLLATITALLSVVAAIIFNFAKHWETLWIVKVFTRLATTGYAIPGAVIAIGILVPALFIDKQLFSGYSLLNYTIIFLVLAYLIRFIAVSNNALESSFKKISPQLTAASRIMGKSSFTTLMKVHLPLVKPGLISAAILVFVEVIKELPLTLIIRPFDYNTLATKCFELASDERIAESSIYSLLIIITGIIPIFTLHYFERKRQ